MIKHIVNNRGWIVIPHLLFFGNKKPDCFFKQSGFMYKQSDLLSFFEIAGICA